MELPTLGLEVGQRSASKLCRVGQEEEMSDLEKKGLRQKGEGRGSCCL